MQYEGTIIRPPNEAGSILLQVAVGCSHNKCTFCGAYKGERFRIKDRETVSRDIASAARQCGDQRRLFLCGGDALVLPQVWLLEILGQIRAQLPWVTRVGAYGSAKALGLKSDAELAELRGAGLGIVYMGLESGDDETLVRVCKHGDSQAIVQQGLRVKQAGLRLSVTVLLGLAGSGRSSIHARATGEALTRMDPQHVGALTLMLMENTPLYADWQRGEFELPDARGMLLELREMLIHTTLSRGLFLANHASNYLPLKVRLPSGKQVALEWIDRALAGGVSLKSEHLRGL
ncbi:MAG: radical SAM protein [Proteobacteria bacterium]|nr:radical SAM protein [Pseudomonadota bacterium]